MTFYNGKMSKEVSYCICLSMILTYLSTSVIEECKCIIKEKKMKRYIKGDLGIASYEEISDKELFAV